MADISTLYLIVEGQDEGLELQIVDPVTGDAIDGMFLTVAGPDSDIQRKARHAYIDAINAVTWSSIGPQRKASASLLEDEHTKRIARHVISWRITRDGESIEQGQRGVTSLFKALPFVQDQVEKFGNSRDGYYLRNVPFNEDGI